MSVAPDVKVKAPVSVNEAAPAGKTKSTLSSFTIGVPTVGVSVSPTSISVTEKLPVIEAKSCFEASANSSIAVGSIVSLSTGASLVPVIVTVTSYVSDNGVVPASSVAFSV